MPANHAEGDHTFDDSSDRYDPLYKALDSTEEVDFVEKRLYRQFDRLKSIDNLGILPLVFKTAHYSKYEHALGTTHQIINLLEVAEKSTKSMSVHKQALMISALFLHLGHCPFTYSTERALLLASARDQSKENQARNYITNKVRIALRSNENKNKKRALQIIDALLEQQDHKLLYKCFSAALLAKNYGILNREFNDFSEKELEKAILNLVDKKSAGYKYLELADTADFVQRDALHFGAARLDISPKHLFSRFSNCRPPTNTEKKLMDYDTYEGKLLKVGLDYLDKRFYKTSKVVCFSILYEKIVAFLISHKSFDLTWLEDLNDDEFKQRIVGPRNKSKGLALPKPWVERARDLFDNRFQFEGIFAVNEVGFPKATAMDVESELAEAKKGAKGFLSYPFDRGILLVVQISHTDPQLEGIHKYSITLFQDESKKNLLPLLKVVQNLSPYVTFNQVQQIREGLATQVSWSQKGQI